MVAWYNENIFALGVSPRFRSLLCHLLAMETVGNFLFSFFRKTKFCWFIFRMSNIFILFKIQNSHCSKSKLLPWKFFLFLSFSYSFLLFRATNRRKLNIFCYIHVSKRYAAISLQIFYVCKSNTYVHFFLFLQMADAVHTVFCLAFLTF